MDTETPSSRPDAVAVLVRRAQGGDRTALTALLAAHQRYVYSVALSVVRDPNDAADVTQEAYLRLLRSLNTYRGETRFTTWLYRLVVNVSLDELRRRRRSVTSPDGTATVGVGGVEEPTDQHAGWRPELAVERRESAAEVRAALAGLPTAERVALTLHYLDDVTSDDIALVLGFPVNTVKSHMRRGKLRLARVLGPMLGRRSIAVRPPVARPRARSPVLAGVAA